MFHDSNNELNVEMSGMIYIKKKNHFVQSKVSKCPRIKNKDV